MKNKFAKLCAILIIINLSCDNDNSSEELIEQIRYSVPTIEQAQENYNAKYQNGTNTNSTFRADINTLDVKWDDSSSKKYDKEPDEVSTAQEINLLFSPIALNARGQFKSFVASVELNGEVHSKIFTIFYFNTENRNAFSGYLLLYSLDGLLENVYMYNEGQRLEQGTGLRLTTNTSSRTSADCDSPFDTIGCLLDWIGGDWFGLDGFIQNDDVVIYGSSGGSGTPVFDSWSAPSIHIPFIDAGGSGGGGGGTAPWWTPDVVQANATAIGIVIGVETPSPEADWLNQASQELLDEIANYLNDNIEIDSTDNSGDGVTEGDSGNNNGPNVSQTAINFLLDFINDAIGSNTTDLPVVVFEGPDNPIEDMDDFLSCIDKTQPAKLTIYADQPITNSIIPVGPDRAGHAFVSLTQNGNTIVYGFYPENTLDGIVLSPGAIGNDQNHEYDVSYTTDIDSSELTNIINFSLNVPFYNLNFYNCTDYAIAIGNKAGLNLPSCYVIFAPGPGGSAPSALGQHLRNKETTGTDTKNTSGGNAPAQSGDCD